MKILSFRLKLFVSILAQIAGATIAAASKVIPIEVIDAITTPARTSEKRVSTSVVLTPYTCAVSVSNTANRSRF